MPLLKSCQQGWGGGRRIVLCAVGGETDGVKTGGGGVGSYLFRQTHGHLCRILPAGVSSKTLSILTPSL